jgi:hypothetical protein
VAGALKKGRCVKWSTMAMRLLVDVNVQMFRCRSSTFAVTTKLSLLFSTIVLYRMRPLYFSSREKKLPIDLLFSFRPPHIPNSPHPNSLTGFETPRATQTEMHSVPRASVSEYPYDENSSNAPPNDRGA